MATLLQLIKNGRKAKTKENKRDSDRLQSKLVNKPQKKVVCLKLTTMTPKKPNSANRRIAKVSLNQPTNRLKFNVKIPGEGHNLQQHSTILIKNGTVRDLIGVNTIAIRGKYDLAGVKNRKSSRSIYGIKLIK